MKNRIEKALFVNKSSIVVQELEVNAYIIIEFIAFICFMA